MVKNLPAVQETCIRSLGCEDLLENGTATHSSILAWRITWTIEHGVTKSRTRLNDFHFQVALAVKTPPANAGDASDAVLIPALGRSGGECGNPLQYSCLENPIDRETWQATIQGVAKSLIGLSVRANVNYLFPPPENILCCG